LHSNINVGAQKSDAAKFTLPRILATWFVQQNKASACDFILSITL
jgi:hypothetical protein